MNIKQFFEELREMFIEWLIAVVVLLTLTAIVLAVIIYLNYCEAGSFLN